MNPLTLLLVLLVVAYIGGHWTKTPGKRAFGSASGIEYVLLGIALGPHALGALDTAALHAFEPVELVALGYIALGYGVEVFSASAGPVHGGRLLLGLASSAGVALCTGACVYASAIAFAWAVPGPSLFLLSAAATSVSALGARDSFLWISEHEAARGPLARWLTEFSRANAAPALLFLPFMFAFFHAPQSVFGWSVIPLSMASGSLLMGVLLGLCAGWLIAASSSDAERWTILLGSSWLATGTSEGLGLSAMGSCFALGVVLGMSKKKASALSAELARTEGSVLLPALLLSGAHLSPPRTETDWLLLGSAALGHLLSTLLIGYVLSLTLRRPPAQRGPIALALLSSGTSRMLLALAIFLRFHGDVGQSVLSIAFVGTLLGELLGLPALRRALLLAGEARGSEPEPALQVEAGGTP